ncbi:GDP-L-fucose synthase family protein [Cryptosporangium aurantiacum]|uniref:GDP-L-fucose synthase n=1 Tax=Cryptosporangium aurantiacum TaxID=134849 RepID=A0A1M7QXQ2_9ACTN|nr:GDP-L-fucose synthase [Cryptosporangium aurantiacum]SHN36538.1 GDP-L-fucose synthase [Cryptosporangium aurantiacum]
MATAPFHHPVPRDARVYIAGHGGLVGSALWRHFESVGFTNLVGRRSKELDLRDRESVRAFFDEVRPDYVIDAAAKVGGIFANSTYPAEFLSDNLRIQTNLLDAAHEFGVERFLFLGSSCIYPKFAPQPIREDSLLTGPLEETNDAYAIAKISGVMQVQAIRRQYGRNYISAMPTNLYGPGDNFEIPGAHVMPMVMRRMHEAVAAGDTTFTIYGTGTPRREFLHTDDLARACLTLLERYDNPAPINIGVGEDVTIDELVQMIADVVGYTGEFTHDTSKPDGTPRKVLDVSRIKALGWEPTVELCDGIRSVYEWFLTHQTTFRH